MLRGSKYKKNIIFASRILVLQLFLHVSIKVSEGKCSFCGLFNHLCLFNPTFFFFAFLCFAYDLWILNNYNFCNVERMGSLGAFLTYLFRRLYNTDLYDMPLSALCTTAYLSKNF
jgi:hypothetical protein